MRASLKYAIASSLLAVVVSATCGPAYSDEPSAVTFYAMGDVPYAPGEDELLPKQIAVLPNDADFVVHVGDIKPGAPPCDEAVYTKVAGMLRKSSAPVFIIPGDNEWNDCLNPDEAWQFWDRHFMRFDAKWKHKLDVSRQPDRAENFAFVRRHVLFVGLNIVGGRVHDADEWKQRHAADLEWLRLNLRQSGDAVSSLVIFGHAHPGPNHKDVFEPLADDARKFQKPILYLHGDGHKWLHNRPFGAKNILRVQVDQGGIAPPLRVTVTNDPEQPFQFDRRNGKPAR